MKVTGVEVPPPMPPTDGFSTVITIEVPIVVVKELGIVNVICVSDCALGVTLVIVPLTSRWTTVSE